MEPDRSRLYRENLMATDPRDKHFRMGVKPPRQRKKRLNKDGTPHTGNPHKESASNEAEPAGSGEPATAD